MKESIAGILQTRMDKCTSEQFWAIGVLTAVGGFFICQKSLILAELPAWSISGISIILAIYAGYWVIQRHKAYYDLLNDLKKLVEINEEESPQLIEMIVKWKGDKWSGLLFYLGCDIVITIAIEVTYYPS